MTPQLKDASIEYFPQFLDTAEADRYMNHLINSVSWKQEKIRMFGKEILQPRLTAFYGDSEKSYSYSGLKMKPTPFNEDLRLLKLKTEAHINSDFNVCLLNLYRDGKDSMGWHADDEKELGPYPVIASISLGAERMFHLKHKTDPTARYKIRLQHGSLLVMKGKTQEFWKHQLPKTSKVTGPRLNLTFRKIL